MGRRLLRSDGGSEATLWGVSRPHVNPADGRQYQRGGLDALIRNLFQVGFVKQGLAPEAISVLHYRWPICSFVMKVVILAN